MDDREIQQLLMRGAIVGMANGQLCVGWGDALALESASPSAVSFYAPDFYLENKNPGWCSPTTASCVRLYWSRP